MTTIDIFKRAVSQGEKLSFAEVNALAVRCGYLIHPDCCTREVYNWLKGVYINPNSTFYKAWDDIVSKSRIELLFDQVLHYMSTYGTSFEATPYVPNDAPEEIPYKEYKTILPISAEGLYIKCVNLITYSVALSYDTMICVCDYIVSYVKENNITFDIDSVNNKEAIVYLCNELEITPKDKFNLLRYIIYQATSNPLLIQNTETIKSIKAANLHNRSFDFSVLSEEQIVALSSIFLRFKNLFLAFKGYKNNSHIINHMRRLAVKTHQPMRQDFWNTLCFLKPDITEVTKRLSELSTFKKVSLYSAVAERIRNFDKRVFIIRNQKIFITDNTADKSSYYLHLLKAIVTSIAEDLKPKACAYVLPENLYLACPSSEKNFVGDLPIGSYFEFQKNAILGIYWREEWGTRDFDLSLVDAYGNKIGWNTTYYNPERKVIYSGDMTSANPEASELLLFCDPTVEGIIQINRYCGEDKSKYRFFYSNEEVKSLTRNYMVDPNSIKVNVECVSDASQQSLAIINNQIVTFMRLGTGYSQVSGQYSAEIFKALKDKAECYLDLKYILTLAGFRQATSEDENPLVFTKETILELFSKE